MPFRVPSAGSSVCTVALTKSMGTSFGGPGRRNQAVSHPGSPGVRRVQVAGKCVPRHWRRTIPPVRLEAPQCP
ncbi:hypothetical protein Val02_09580 [Virgisporangium aliadipatigenens]|uniref:Uncharacterized protein n=1 Tax=Virgisporangium aliadipatigenens TaxID=741659 RepID=A0A8J3YGQ2_9ACTN|nr:hypothetical protein Val02_09580 [Virgisporangium aliadipatigenens]